MVTGAVGWPLVMLGSAPDSGGAWAAATPATTASNAANQADWMV